MKDDGHLFSVLPADRLMVSCQPKRVMYNDTCRVVAALPQPAFEFCTTTSAVNVNAAWAKSALDEDGADPSAFWLQAFHPDERCAAQWRIFSLLEAASPEVWRARLRDAATGHFRWHVLSACPIMAPSGDITTWSVIATDIHDLSTPTPASGTPDGQAPSPETELRVLGARVLDAISAGDPLVRVLDLIASTVDALVPQVRSTLLLVEDDRLGTGVAPRFPVSYLQAVHGVPIGERSGTCGTAAARRSQVFTADIASDPLWQGLQDVAAAFDLVACWSTPILDAQGDVLAVFGLYPSSARSPMPHELALIDEIGKYVRVAIERTRQTEQLRRSETRYRSLYDMVPVLIWEEDWCDVIPALQRLQLEGVTDFISYFDANPQELIRIIKSVRVLGVNQTGARMFGAASGEELLGAFDDLVESPGALRVFKKSLAAWAAGEREMEAESVNFDLYGRALHLLVKVALPDPDGGDTRVVLSEMDMTALRLADERFRIIAQATSDVVLDRDLISGTAWCSDGLLERFGHAPAVIADNVNAIFGLIHPDDRSGIQTSLTHALAGSVEKWQAQFRLRRADGSYAEVRERSIILRDDAGRALRLIGSLVDITEQTRLEDELRQSQRLDAIGQLTGGVAHDFNNLLTVILGNSEILSEAIKDERLRGLAEMCSAAALRGAELTSRLLAFARKQPLDPKRVDVNALILGLEGLLRRALGEQVIIEPALSDAVGAAIADATQLESAILNLCLNARDAMPQGGQLRIETANEEITLDEPGQATDLVPGPYVVISIRDTGIGMDAATLARAVEPFFTTKEVGKGSGLGLSMVYGFAKQSSGHVEIFSTPGAGTTVRLSLPRCQDGSLSEEAQGTDTPAPAGTETILLVEDDELVREHVEAQLRSLGYAVVSVSTGTEALAALADGHSFDLLFTDVVMPGGMSGPELAGHARDLFPDLPILFTSGYSEDHIGRQRPLRPGQELLRKPYRRQDLAVAIRAVLDEDATR